MPLKVNSLVVVQVKKEDIGSLLDDAVKQGTKSKIGGKAEKENSEEVDDPTLDPTLLAPIYPDVTEQVTKMVNTDTERSKRKCL